LFCPPVYIVPRHTVMQISTARPSGLPLDGRPPIQDVRRL
jgi:hypothetical protein